MSKERDRAGNVPQLDGLRHSAAHRTGPHRTLQPLPRNVSRALRIQKQRSCEIGFLVLGAKEKEKETKERWKTQSMSSSLARKKEKEMIKKKKRKKRSEDTHVFVVLSVYSSWRQETTSRRVYCSSCRRIISLYARENTSSHAHTHKHARTHTHTHTHESYPKH